MRLPLRSWRDTLSSLGLKWADKPRKQKRRRQTVRLGVETLEARQMLSITPLDDEFLVNSNTTNTQKLWEDSGRAVAFQTDGQFVASWTSTGQDGSNYGVYGHRFGDDGAALGSEFRANTTTNNAQKNSTISTDASGNYVIAWESAGQDGDQTGIYAQRYNAAGTAQGSEFQVSVTSTGTQELPEVAHLADGGFVVAWSGKGTGDVSGVYIRHYNSSGVAQTGEILVNTHTSNEQSHPSIAPFVGGGFVLAWESHGGQDGESAGVYAQRFDSSAAKVGGEFRVNSTTNSFQQRPSVAAAADDSFVVVWESNLQDGNAWGIFGQRYNASGQTVGSEFAINQYTTGDQQKPSVAFGPSGGFLVVWSGKGTEDNAGIYAREYDSSGQPVDDQFLVNTYTNNAQVAPTVAGTSTGYVITWSGQGQLDTSDEGVYGRIFVRVNTAPTTSGIADVAVSEDAAATVINLYNAFADAEDADNLLTYTVTANTKAGLFSSTPISAGTLTLNYAANASGAADITVRATDPLGLFVETTFHVTVAAVNDQPTTTGIANVSVEEDSANVTRDLWGAFADVEDADNQLTYTVESNTNAQLFTAVTVVAATGLLVLDFGYNKNGQGQITVRATDSGGLYRETTLDVEVAAVNDPPTTSGFFDVTADEDQGATTVGVAGGFFDIEDDAQLVYTVAQNTNPGLFSSTPINGAGVLALNYAANAYGEADLTLRATDPEGLYVESTFHVTVNPVNDQPTTSGIADVSVNEDAAATVIDLFGPFADVEDSDAQLTYAIVGNTNSALFSSVDVDGQQGTLTLNYAANAHGQADITVRATDTGGLYRETTFHVAVAAVNDQPTSSGIDDVEVSEDAQPTAIDLHSAFADVEDADGQLTYAVVGNTNSSLFSSTLISAQNGTLTLNYAANAHGESDITVRATDTGGLYRETTFHVTVDPVNDQPTTGGIADVSVLDTASQSVINLFDAFADVETADSQLTYSIVGNTNAALFSSTPMDSQAGTLTLNYSGTSGTGQVTVRATDADGLYVETTFDVEVIETNTPPDRVGIPTIFTTENAQPEYRNLREYFADAEDPVEDLVFTIVGNTNPGLITTDIDNDGILTISFAPNVDGDGVITIRATDTGGLFINHEVYIVVAPANEAPQIAGLLLGPQPAVRGGNLSLRAEGITDDGNSVASVTFYRDVDDDGLLTIGVDQLLAADTQGQNGYEVTVSTAGFAEGPQTYFAVAKDTQGLASAPAVAHGSIGIAGVVDNTLPGYTEIGAGWTDGSGGYEGAHRQHAAGTGENLARWTFSGLTSAPHQVLVTWAEGADRASNATFKIYDGEDLVRTVVIDQRVAPDDVLVEGTLWASLGSIDLESDTITIELSDNADGIVVADAVRLIDPIPTIGALAVSSKHMVSGDSLTLTAQNVADTDGTVTEVQFWRDADNDGQLSAVNDQLLFTDTSSTGGWTATVSSSSFTGSHTTGVQAYFAVAVDDTDAESLPAKNVNHIGINPVMIDNGQAGYAQVGTWSSVTGGGTVNNQSVLGAAGTGAKTATWTFSGLGAGKTFQVMTSFRPVASNALNAPYTISDNTTALDTVRISHRVAADDVTASGVNWEILGYYKINSGTLKVQLTDAAGGPVSSDAIRIVEVVEDPDLIDNGDVIGDATYAETGSGWSTTTDAATYAGNYRQHAAGTGTNTARWTYGSLDPSQLYEVQVTWKSGGDRATDAAFTIYDGDTAAYIRTLNQQSAPSGATMSGVTWQSLGYFKPTQGALAVELTDDANGIVVADAVRLVRKAAAPEVIDNGQAGYAQVGTWTSAPAGGSYNNSYLFNAAGTGADKASWTFDGLKSGKTYQVLASFRSSAAQASNAPFTVSDGTTALETVAVNQRLIPDDVVFNGINFETLGYFVIHNGVMKVELTDAANGSVVADAIRVVEVVENPYIIDNGDSVGDATYSETGTGWNTTTDGTTYGGGYRQHASGTGDNTARWTYEAVNPGQLYEVYVTWKSGGDRATDAQFTVYDNTTAKYTRTVNQQSAPTGLTQHGVTWQSLGYYKADSGILAIELTDEANGVVVADAVKIVARAAAPSLIDNGQSGFAVVGTWTSSVSGDTYNGNFVFNAPGSGADKASWTFGGLETGKLYQVTLSYKAQNNNATNAPFTLYDGTTALETVLVNQRVATSEINFGGVLFNTLAYATVTSGVLKVELTDAATGGNVVADSIRLIEVAENPGVIDNGDNQGTETYSETGTGWTLSTGSGAYAGNYRQHAAGSGANKARWTYTGMDPTKLYEVLVSWKEDTDRATNAQFTVRDGDTVKAVRTLNQQQDPGGVTLHGITWKSLGYFAPTEGELSVELTDDANGIVIADAVKIIEKARAPELIDNVSPGFATVGLWNTSVSNATYGNTFHFTGAGTGSRYATWTFDGLESGQVYEVQASWKPAASNAPDAPFTILDGTVPIDTIDVNQQIEAATAEFENVMWERLTYATSDTGTVTIKLSDATTTGGVIADAVRLLAVAAPVTLSIPTGVIAGMAIDVAGTAGGIFGTHYTGFEFFQDTNLNSVLDVGIDALLDFVNAASFAFQADTSDSAVAAGIAATGGEFRGFVRTMTPTGNGQPTAVKAKVTPNWAIKDNKDVVAFQTFGTDAWRQIKNKGGYEKSYQETYKVGNFSATWKFETLPNGTYDVYATYTKAPTNTAKARFRVHDSAPNVDGSSPYLAEARLNQRAAPTLTVPDVPGKWEIIGTVTITDGTAWVEVSTAGTGDCWVVADAVMFRQVERNGVAIEALFDADELDQLPGQFIVTRSGIASEPLTVKYSVTTQNTPSATPGDDYEALSGTVSFKVGQTQVEINVIPTSDSLVEGAEYINLTLTPDNSYTIDTGMESATISILDAAPTIFISEEFLFTSEGTSPADSFLIGRTGDLTNALTVYYSVENTAGLSATAGVDYVALSGSITFAPSEATASIPVETIEDSIGEDIETVDIVLVEASSYVIDDARSQSTMMIEDNEPIITIEATVDSASEAGVETGTFVIRRSGTSLSSPLTVNYSIITTGQYKATPGDDYVALLGTVTIPSGESEAPVLVTPLDDSVVEGNETVDLKLETGSGYHIDEVTGTTAAVTIYDDEPVVAIAASVLDEEEEGQPPASVTFTRTGNTSTSLTVYFSIITVSPNPATPTDDYPALSGSVTFNANESQAVVEIDPIDDAIFEATESVDIKIDTNSFYSIAPDADRATVYILDNEPIITIEAVDAIASEEGAEAVDVQQRDSGQFAFYRFGGDLSSSLTVSFKIDNASTATHNTDYVLSPDAADAYSLQGTIDFPANEDKVFLDVVPLQDHAEEPTEKVVVRLLEIGSPGSTTYGIISGLDEAEVEILDNEPAIAIAGTADGVEPGAASFVAPATGHFTLTRPYSSDLPVLNVNYQVIHTTNPKSASSNDYSPLSGTATFAQGELTTTIDVSPLADSELEGAEFVDVELIPDSNYSAASYTVASQASSRIYIHDLRINITAHQAGTMSSAGAAVSEADEDNPDNLIFFINDDSDDNPQSSTPDNADSSIGSADDDVVMYRIDSPGVTAGTVTVSFSNEGTGAAIRVFDSSGYPINSNSITVDLASPSGPLAGLVAGPIDLFVEATAAGRLVAEVDYQLAQNPVSDSAYAALEARPTLAVTIGDKQQTGDWIPRNDWDRDHDGIPDFADGLDTFANNAAAEMRAKQFVPLEITVAGVADLTKAAFKVEYFGADPGAIQRTGNDPNVVFTPGAGDITIWKNGIFTNADNTIVSRKHREVDVEGDWIKSGKTYSGAQIGLDVITRKIVLWVEGISPNADLRSITVTCYPDSINAIPAQSVQYAVAQIDLDIDSDNDGPIGTINGAAASAIEDNIESYGIFSQGKLIPVNNGNADGAMTGDTIKDYSDGFKIGAYDQFRDGASAKFTPITLTIPAQVDLTKARVMFTYSANAPRPDGTLAEEGLFRIWTKDGDKARDGRGVDAGGDFIDSRTVLTISQLKARGPAPVDPEARTITLFVEGVLADPDSLGQTIVVEMSPHPGTTARPLDSVYVTSYQYGFGGQITYDSTAEKPVRGARILLSGGPLGAAGIGLPAVPGYTRDDGKYFLVLSRPASDYAAKDLVVFAETRRPGNGPNQIRRAVHVSTRNAAAVFQVAQATRTFEAEVGGGNAVFLAGNVVIGNDLPADNSEKAFWVYDAMVTASRFHAELPGVDTGSTKLWLGKSIYATSLWDPAVQAIRLKPVDFQDWDSIIHEYGHAVAHEAGFFRFDIRGLTHTIIENARYVPTNRIPPAPASKAVLDRLAFSEGWANLFSLLAQDDQGVTVGLPALDFNGIPGANQAGDGKLYLWSLEDATTALGALQRNGGDDLELVATRIQWDLADPANEAADHITGTSSQLFDLYVKNTISSLSQLWNVLSTINAGRGAIGNEVMMNVGRIFQEHRVSAIPFRSEGTAAINTWSAINDGALAIPTFRFKIPKTSGDDPAFTNFGIKVFAGDGTELFDSDISAPGKPQFAIDLKTIGADGTFEGSFTPTKAQWLTMVRGRVPGAGMLTTLKWVVYSRDIRSNVVIKGVVFPFTGGTSGDYWSGAQTLTLLP